MADAINAKSDVLGERELDAVSGGSISIAGLVGLVEAVIKIAGGGQQSGGESNGGGSQDPLSQLFQQLMQPHGT
jgi:hypothetical protein